MLKNIVNVCVREFDMSNPEMTFLKIYDHASPIVKMPYRNTFEILDGSICMNCTCLMRRKGLKFAIIGTLYCIEVQVFRHYLYAT